MSEKRVERSVEQHEERVETGAPDEQQPAPSPQGPQGPGPHGLSEGGSDGEGLLVNDADGAPRGA